MSSIVRKSKIFNRKRLIIQITYKTQLLQLKMLLQTDAAVVNLGLLETKFYLQAALQFSIMLQVNKDNVQITRPSVWLSIHRNRIMVNITNNFLNKTKSHNSNHLQLHSLFRDTSYPLATTQEPMTWNHSSLSKETTFKSDTIDSNAKMATSIWNKKRTQSIFSAIKEQIWKVE